MRTFDTGNPAEPGWSRDWTSGVSFSAGISIAIDASGRVAVSGSNGGTKTIEVFNADGSRRWVASSVAGSIDTVQNDGLAFDPSGNLWAAFSAGSPGEVVKLDEDGATLLTTATSSATANNKAIALNSNGDLFASFKTTTDGKVRKYSGSTGVEITSGAWPLNVQDDAGGGWAINTLILDSADNIFAAGGANGGDREIYKYTAAGALDSMATLKGWDTPPTQSCLAVNASDDLIAAITNRVRAYSGGSLGSIAWTYEPGTPSTASFTAVAAHSDGGAFAIDSITGELVRISAAGAEVYRVPYSSPALAPYDIAAYGNAPHLVGRRT